jgi:hypothetical protein
MKITVNGTLHHYGKERADYYDIVRLARKGREPTMGWTVTYFWQGDGDSERNGSLCPSKNPIKVMDGMIFDAVITGNA